MIKFKGLLGFRVDVSISVAIQDGSLAQQYRMLQTWKLSDEVLIEVVLFECGFDSFSQSLFVLQNAVEIYAKGPGGISDDRGWGSVYAKSGRLP